jgi:hypothetical protein
MRLWSIHPKYLDKKGLVALWREGLLAKRVLEGKTKGYRNHPQLQRFKELKNPLLAINSYLYFVWREAKKRGYNFRKEKISSQRIIAGKIPVTKGQIKFEFSHLCKKLEKRDKRKLEEIKKEEKIFPEVNPVFYIIKGKIERWEKI